MDNTAISMNDTYPTVSENNTRKVGYLRQKELFRNLYKTYRVQFIISKDVYYWRAGRKSVRTIIRR
jgi:hypothetical protein